MKYTGTTAAKEVEVRAVGRSGWVQLWSYLTEWDALDPYDFRLAVWLATHSAEYEGRLSQAGIGRRLKMSQERVQKSLDRLIALGLVTVGTGGVRGAKQITFLREAWEAPPPLATREVTSRHTGGDLSPGETQERSVEKEHKNTQSSSRTSSSPRRADPIWDVLTAEVGPVEGRAESSRRGKVVKELKELGASPQEITVRCARYRSKWPSVTLTDTALVAHWSKFGAPLVEIFGPDGDDAYGGFAPREF